MIYLAAPYNHASQEIRDARMEVTTRWVAAYPWLTYFSPLTYSQRVRRFMDPSFKWLDFDWQYFQLCHTTHILALPGWEESEGVTEERQWSQDRDMGIVVYADDMVRKCLQDHDMWDDSLLPAFQYAA